MKVTEEVNTVLVTGSSGYVASELIPLLPKCFSVFGVDNRSSLLTSTVVDISSSDFKSLADEMPAEGVSIINSAAARFDFGADTLAILGYDVGAVLNVANKTFLVPSFDMQIYEDIHLMFGHMVMKTLCGGSIRGVL